MSPGSQSRQSFELWPEASVRHGDILELRARMECRGKSPETLWFRLPAIHSKDVTTSLDPFLIGILFSAMRRATDINVYGRVSPSLLRNLEDFQEAWRCWLPDQFRQVPVRAEEEAEDERPTTDDTLMTFSGGLDSCFTAWRHTQGKSGRRSRNLKAALMVHGFDIPLEESEIFQSAAENSHKLAESVGLELIPLASNFRQLGDDWEMAHGAALAACLHLFRKRFSTGLIAGSHVYSALRFPWGSNPLTDPLLSTTGFPIIYDGGEFSRREKAREVADWPEAMSRMRICWEGERKDRNCGQCVRCVGTAICFAIERKSLPGSLPVKSLDEAIRGLFATRIKPVTVSRLEELAEAARAAKIESRWVDTLEECVRAQRGKASRPLARLKRLLRKPGRSRH